MIKNLTVVLTILFACTGAWAADVDVTGTGLHVNMGSGNGKLTVTGPDGFAFEKQASGVNFYDVHSMSYAGADYINAGQSERSAGLQDGQYKYEVTIIEELGTEISNDTRNGRAAGTPRKIVNVRKESGSFRVVNGEIIPVDYRKEENE